MVSQSWPLAPAHHYAANGATVQTVLGAVVEDFNQLSQVGVEVMGFIIWIFWYRYIILIPKFDMNQIVLDKEWWNQRVGNTFLTRNHDFRVDRSNKWYHQSSILPMHV